MCVECPLRSPGQAPYVSRCSQAGFKPKFLGLEGFGWNVSRHYPNDAERGACISVYVTCVSWVNLLVTLDVLEGVKNPFLLSFCVLHLPQTI